jgi:alkane 1-monooxygenase
VGTLAYSKMLYSHFFIQHIRSHHKFVGTPMDTVTAKMGESVFSFYLRVIPEGFVEVFELEKKRLQQEGKSPYSLENRVFCYNLV